MLKCGTRGKWVWVAYMRIESGVSQESGVFYLQDHHWFWYTGAEMSSILWHFRHWRHVKLSFWQLLVQPVTTIASQWRRLVSLSWPVTWLAPRHYLNQWWFIINSKIANTLSGIYIKMQQLSYKKIILKTSSKWRLFSLLLNVLSIIYRWVSTRKM